MKVLSWRCTEESKRKAEAGAMGCAVPCEVDIGHIWDTK